MRVLKRISDGRILEAQGGGVKPEPNTEDMTDEERDAALEAYRAESQEQLDVLVRNVSADYAPSEVKVVIMDEEDFAADLKSQAESDKPYDAKRREEFPSIGEQLDDLYRHGAFSKEMTDKITAIKNKYPKPV